eukprot:1507345-Pyramimonas_sp.AAC.1
MTRGDPSDVLILSAWIISPMLLAHSSAMRPGGSDQTHGVMPRCQKAGAARLPRSACARRRPGLA